MFQQIMIAWDGSPAAEWAFGVALDIARRYDAELVAVAVAHSPAHAETAADRRESVDAAQRYLEQSFVGLRDRAERAGVAVEQTVLQSDEPAAAILDHAHEHGFDLLVIGHHRRRAGRFLIHGLAEKTIEASDVPVLVVATGGPGR
jgi:nucleotide-binding universal stress UspA family protein